MKFMENQISDEIAWIEVASSSVWSEAWITSYLNPSFHLNKIEFHFKEPILSWTIVFKVNQDRLFFIDMRDNICSICCESYYINHMKWPILYLLHIIWIPYYGPYHIDWLVHLDIDMVHISWFVQILIRHNAMLSFSCKWYLWRGLLSTVQ